MALGSRYLVCHCINEVRGRLNRWATPSRDVMNMHSIYNTSLISKWCKNTAKRQSIGYISRTPQYRLEQQVGYMHNFVMEATEIHLHPDNLNRNVGFSLSHSSLPATNKIKQAHSKSILRTKD
jgi:hypothetical protein